MDFLDHLFTPPSLDQLSLDNESSDAFPAHLKEWFRKLLLLKGVPLNYLIPHPQQLPLESVRFFNLDTNWLKALAAGAFSLGQYSYETEAEARYRDFSAAQLQDITGMIIRSSVVQHYPGMHCKAYAQEVKQTLPNDHLEILRNEKIAPDIRLILFNGQVKTVALFSPPESLELSVDHSSWLDKNGVLQTEKIFKEKKTTASSVKLTDTLISKGHYILFHRK